MLPSRGISENDLDSQNLRGALDLIIADLTIPFLEKRARNKAHKKTPLEELNAVIEELTGREKELQAAVGIAKMLLDRNDALNDKRKQLLSKVLKWKGKCKNREREIETLKESLYTLDDKYQQLSNTMVKCEEDQIHLLAENKRILYEQSLKQERISPRKGSIDNEIMELQEILKSQSESMQSIF